MPATGRGYIVAGIHTDAGKTFVSAILMAGLDAAYWKPVQSGSPTDADSIRKYLSGYEPEIHPEAYRLQMPASPDIAAKAEGIQIEADQLTPPLSSRPLIIEIAGGIMVPLAENLLTIDLFRQWNLPVILVVPTYLGAINHTLLSLEALRQRKIPVAGIIFNHGNAPEGANTIKRLAGVPVLGNIPFVESTGYQALRKLFTACIHLQQPQI